MLASSELSTNIGGLVANLAVVGDTAVAVAAAALCANVGRRETLMELNKPAKNCERFKTGLSNQIQRVILPLALCATQLKTLQNQAMLASSATNFEKVRVFGVNLEVWRIPAQPLPSQSLPLSPIVFLREGLGSVAMWRDFPQQLCQATGRAGWVYSRRGYGQSDPVEDVRVTGRLKPDYMHREAYEVLPELLRIEGISNPVLLGHSDGGTIALLHAALFPVEACIVMAPHWFVEDISIAAITQARDAYEKGDLRQRLAKFHAEVDGAFWQWNDIWLSDEFRGFDISQECQGISCPLLAIQGHDDTYGTMAQIDALGDVDNMSKAAFLSQIALQPASNRRRTLLKLEQCGHSPQRDQPERVLHSIAQWLSNPC